MGLTLKGLGVLKLGYVHKCYEAFKMQFYFILLSDVVRGQTGVVRHRQEGDADQGDQEPD